jgi:hypothetical protein
MCNPIVRFVRSFHSKGNLAKPGQTFYFLPARSSLGRKSALVVIGSIEGATLACIPSPLLRAQGVLCALDHHAGVLRTSSSAFGARRLFARRYSFPNVLGFSTQGRTDGLQSGITRRKRAKCRLQARRAGLLELTCFARIAAIILRSE